MGFKGCQPAVSNVLSGIPRTSLTSAKAPGALGEGESHRVCPGDQGLGSGGGHSPVLLTGVGCTWTRGVCRSCGDGLAMGRMMRWGWSDGAVGVEGTGSRGWQQFQQAGESLPCSFTCEDCTSNILIKNS